MVDLPGGMDNEEGKSKQVARVNVSLRQWYDQGWRICAIVRCRIAQRSEDRPSKEKRLKLQDDKGEKESGREDDG